MEDNNSRRKFIQQSALLGAGIMLAGSTQLLAGNAKFKNEKYKMKKGNLETLKFRNWEPGA